MIQQTAKEIFLQSWDEMEAFYYDDEMIGGWLWVLPIRQIMGDLRRLGYDQHLRASQAMYTLVLSRSIQPQLQPGQASIAFTLFRDNTMDVRYYSLSEEITLEFDHTTLDVQIEPLIEKLLQQPIT